ncbi:Eco57I restriction-modification methylase domain-containing protein, partial [Nitrosopumilus sp.]|nr:Eco57I restriction-modification methylase domain-containing protein [Nitrosopumilus sp.]
ELLTFIKCDVFTPENIAKLMIDKMLHTNGFNNNNVNKHKLLLEPSVGNGNLLKYLPNIKTHYKTVDVYELKQEYLDDIPNELSNCINKHNADFLKETISCTYDDIIMNPPYIKIQDLPIEYRIFLKTQFKELKIGMVDIYYGFLLKGIQLLNKGGTMVSITPNSFLYNKSAYQLRKYLFSNKLVSEIIDFKDIKVFNGVSVYCCIMVIKKINNECVIYNDNCISYNDININYSLFNFNTLVLDGSTTSLNTLKNICKISNGIATLRDKIYIHKIKLYDEPCWQKITNVNETKFIIYPYENGKIMDETLFKELNPLTYTYLLKNKKELAKRDKGNKTYCAWYAFGRSQSINKPKNKSIYISSFLHPDNIEKYIIIQEPILHISCLCIEVIGNNNIDDTLKLIINVLIKNKDFIKNITAKRSGGWINISSKTLYDLPLPLPL